jgi:pyrimidine operon attenuation protein/uracil phosphoribosyltransferase
MPNTKTLILDHQKIEQKINRIAYQIYEDNYDQEGIIMAGIASNGYILASLLKEKIEAISPLKVSLLELKIDKKNPIGETSQLALDKESMKNQSIILVDDVLNSGRTMIYGLQAFLVAPIKKLSTAVLLNRSHKRFPVNANYVGLSLATTLQEHIEVDLSDATSYKAFLS